MAATKSEAGLDADPLRIFISYARADKARVMQLAAALASAGHAVWWDRQIGGGAEFAKEIEAALEAADIVLVAWSENSIGSHWVRDEAAAGRDTGRLLPVTLDGSPPPLGFRQLQVIDLSRWNGRDSAPEVDEVLASLGSRGSAARPQQQRSGSARKPSKKGIAMLGAAALGVAAVAGFLYWVPQSEAVAAPELQIAELQSLSPRLEPQMIPQLRQELRAALATDSAIAVSSASVDRNPGARFALSASVDRTADKVKLAVELADRQAGTTLWSKIYELPAAKPELVPRQAAYKIGTVVRCALTSRSKRLQPSALAQWTSLCDELWGSSTGTIDRLLHAARKATEAAPDFSEAWSARAMAAAPVPGSTALGEVEALRKEAIESADRALQLDPENGEAYAAKAFLVPEQDFAAREALFKKAISVRPTDCVCQLVFYGQFLMSLGRIQEAYEQFRRAHEVRPLAPVGSSGMAHALFLLGRDQDARATLSEARELWPDDHGLKMLQLRSSIWSGDYEAALALLDDPSFKVPQPRREPWREGIRALRSGQPAQRQQAIRTLVEASKRPGWNNMVVISSLAALGADIEALGAARRFIGQYGIAGTAVLFEPTLANARNSPEFARLATQLGLTRYWARLPGGPDFCRGASSPVCSTG